MLWRARTTLPDRPGALSRLTAACGDADVNILALQIFPDIDSVTDEVVLRAPESWGLTDVARLLETAGGRHVSVMPCSDGALVDQPTRYVQAAHTVLQQPAAFPDVVARLFEAEADPSGSPFSAVHDVLEMCVGDVTVQIRRTAPFTPTEQARANSLAELVSTALDRAKEPPPMEPGRRLGVAEVPTYVTGEDGVEARIGGTLVGSAILAPADEVDVHRLRLTVDPAWRRRGIGTRLLVEGVRLAAERGAAEVMLRTGADNQAVLPVVLSAGLRSRIRLSGDHLIVRVPVGVLRTSRR